MDDDNNFVLWQRLQNTSQLQKFHHKKLQGSAPTPEQNQWWFLYQTLEHKGVHRGILSEISNKD